MSGRKYNKPGRCKLILYAVLMCVLSVHAQEKGRVDTVIRISPEATGKTPRDQRKKQEVYKVNPWVSIPLSMTMTAGNFIAIPTILHAKAEISHAEIAALRPELLSPLDRWAVEQDPSQRDKWLKVSDAGLPITIASSFVVFLDKNVRKDWAKVLLMFYETQATTFTIYNYSPLGPSFQNRLRPFVYYNNFPESERTSGGLRNSLFSGHTANAAAATFFAVKVYSDYHPETGKRKYLYYALASIPPLFVGYARIKALAHFPSDVFLGLLVGGVSGIGIPSLHKIRQKTVQFGVTYNELGSGVGVTWKPGKKKFKVRNDFNATASLSTSGATR